MDHQIALRINAGLMAGIDRHLDTMRQAHPGARLTRSDAIRDLVVRGLPAGSALDAHMNSAPAGQERTAA